MQLVQYFQGRPNLIEKGKQEGKFSIKLNNKVNKREEGQSTV